MLENQYEDGAPASHDEAYTYDNLDRLTKMNRGSLASGTITDANALYTQRWDGAGGSGGLDSATLLRKPTGKVGLRRTECES